VGVRLIVRNPYTIETNVHGTEVVLRAVAQAEADRDRIDLGSLRKSTKAAFSEDDDLVLGATLLRWAYACSKALDEWLALAYAREKGVPVTIVRFFNTVGPRQTGRYGMVLPNFAAQAVQGEPITVYGTGSSPAALPT
jgi:UDP-glucose 4-epimerase